jgi:hypothetical protein
MPRYDSQNLAAIDPNFRRQHNLDGGGKANNRYTYGKQVLIAAGNDLVGNGLCLRLMPIYEEGTTNVVNFREGPDNVAMGDWCRLLTVAHWVGNPGVCFIVHDGDPNKDIRESPYNLLYNVAWKNKETPGIGRLFSELLQKPKVLKSSIGSLTKPEKMLFISASIVGVDDRGRVTLSAFSDDPKRNARIIGLKFSALQSLFSALQARDPATNEHLSGDMLSMGGAKLLTILPEAFDSGSQKIMGIGANGPEVFHCPKYARGGEQYIVGYPPPDRRSAFTHFAFLHDTFNGQEISLEPFADRIAQEAGSWDQHLYIPSYEEQAELLAPAFPREALEFAWQEYPQYLRALSRRSSSPHAAPPTESEFIDDENDDAVQAFSKPPRVAPQASMTQPVETPKAESAPAADYSVSDIFENASTPSAPTPQAVNPATAGKLNAADILARAKSRLATNK